MNKWLARLEYAWRRHGPIAFTVLAVQNIYHSIFRRLKKSYHFDEFDAKYGTDTAGIREIGTLDIVHSPSARYAIRYEPSSAQLVRSELDKLALDVKGFTFIDFGSGKGRVLLVAATLPFKEVIGIELSRELHEAALENIARLPPDVIRTASIRSIHADAASFELPKSDLVCYFYNPFGPPVLMAVAQRLVAHCEHLGFRAIVIYVDPTHREIFEATERFVILDESPHLLVLTTPSGTGTESDD